MILQTSRGTALGFFYYRHGRESLMVSREHLAEIDLRINEVEKILTQLRALRGKVFRQLVDERARVELEDGRK